MPIQTAIRKTREAIHNRKRRRNRQARLFKRTGKRGHARVARREANAIKRLRKRLRHLLRPRPEVMYDSVTVSAIPADAKAVAGYVNGRYITVPDLRKRYGRGTQIVTIAVTSAVVADCLDVEPGDATNSDAPRWFKDFKHQRPNDKPIFYTSASNASALVATLAAAGIYRGDFKLWTAHYADKHLCGPDTCKATSHHADATQWTNASHGRNLDESVCRRSFWERG